MATATFDVFRPAQTARQPIQLAGDLHVVFGEIQLDNGDYVTGGIEVPAALVGLDSIDHVFVGHSSVPAHAARWDIATSLLLIYEGNAADGIEVEHPASAIGDNSFYPVVILGRLAE